MPKEEIISGQLHPYMDEPIPNILCPKCLLKQKLDISIIFDTFVPNQHSSARMKKVFWSFIPLLISSALYSQPKKSTGISQCKRHEKNLDNDVVLGVPCILKSIKDVSRYYSKFQLKRIFSFC